ncbi:MAG: ABC transporter ATP-binding protein [Deltaproteobacteria bacterium]|nr:ABC transporter ATP-binding protein [Deltaproteobacteria bacterium]
MSSLLSVRNLIVRFKTRGVFRTILDKKTPAYIEAVCDVSFDLNPGETFGLVGESGSGKTTLGRSIIGLVKPYHGNILFEDEELIGRTDADFKRFRRDMAMMFQDPVGCLSPRMTIGSLIAEPFKIHGLAGKKMTGKVHELLDLVGLPSHFARRYPHQLSGGQARRVCLARALALSPKVIIADEPTAGLDVSIQGDILNMLGKMQRDYGVSIMAITHNLAVVRHISDRVAIMYLGRFVEIGPTEEIFALPRHPYTHALLSANPIPDPDDDGDRVELVGEVPSLLFRPSGCEFHTRCPVVQEKCRSHAPIPMIVGPQHIVACHYQMESISTLSGRSF